MRANYQKLKDLSVGNGASLFGVADIADLRKDFHLPSRELFLLAISLAFRLSDPIIEELEEKTHTLIESHREELASQRERIEGRLMGELMKQFRGKIDGKIVHETLKRMMEEAMKNSKKS